MKLDSPEIIKQGSRYGIKLKSVDHFIYMIRVDVESTFEPIIGSELQCKELIDYITKDNDIDYTNIWKSEIFVRSLDEIFEEGIQAKLSLTLENAWFKLQNMLTKLVNKGGENLFTICNITDLFQFYFARKMRKNRQKCLELCVEYFRL